MPPADFDTQVKFFVLLRNISRTNLNLQIWSHQSYEHLFYMQKQFSYLAPTLQIACIDCQKETPIQVNWPLALIFY